VASRVLEPPERVLLSACLSVAGSGNFFFLKLDLVVIFHLTFDVLCLLEQPI
jgi:hypothetical protein